MSTRGTKKHLVGEAVKLALSGREDEPLLDVGAGTGIVGRIVSTHFLGRFYWTVKLIGKLVYWCVTFGQIVET